MDARAKIHVEQYHCSSIQIGPVPMQEMEECFKQLQRPTVAPKAVTTKSSSPGKFHGPPKQRPKPLSRGSHAVKNAVTSPSPKFKALSKFQSHTYKQGRRTSSCNSSHFPSRDHAESVTRTPTNPSTSPGCF